MKHSMEIKIKDTCEILHRAAKKIIAEVKVAGRPVYSGSPYGIHFIKGLLRVSNETFKPLENTEWMAFAREYGAEYAEMEGKPVVSCNHAGTKIVCQTDLPGENSKFATLRANVTNPDNLRFQLRQKSWTSLIPWPLKIVKTENGEFDSHFSLKSNTPEIARHIFTSKPVFGILKKHMPAFFHLDLDATDTLRLKISYGETQLDRWFALFRLMIDIFHTADEDTGPGRSGDAIHSGTVDKEDPEPGHSLENLIAKLNGESYQERRDAIRAMGQMGDARATDPLIAALKDGQILIREEAAKALGMIGDRHTINALTIALSDEFSVCREAANALGRIGGMCAVGPLLEAENLMRVSQVMQVSRFGRTRHMEVRLAISNALKSIIGANQEIMNQYPRLFCSKCLRRAARINVSKGTFKDVALAVCPECNDTTHLLTGAERIVGVIGGPGKDITEDGGTVYVRLWFDKEKRIRYADIDRLEIRAGGVTHYEHAINALILELTADSSRPVSSTKGIPTGLEGNPPLSEGAMRMLKANFDLKESGCA